MSIVGGMDVIMRGWGNKLSRWEVELMPIW